MKRFFGPRAFVIAAALFSFGMVQDVQAQHPDINNDGKINGEDIDLLSRQIEMDLCAPQNSGIILNGDYNLSLIHI